MSNVVYMNAARSPIDSMTPRPIPRPRFLPGDSVVVIPVAMTGIVEDLTWIGTWMYRVRLSDGTREAYAERELDHDGGPNAA